MKKMERMKKPIISGLFVFEQKKQRREICKTCFFFEKKSVRGSENRKTKRKQKRQTTKRVEERTKQKTPK